MEDVAEAFGHEPQIGSFPPGEQVQRRVQEVPAGVRANARSGTGTAAAAAGHMHMRPPAEVLAPGGVILEELLSDAPGDGVVEDVGGVVVGEGSGRSELGVGEEEYQVLPLVADVVGLEAEGGAEPVEEVGAVGVPGAGERRRREVRRARQRRHRRAHLREPQRRVVPVHHHVLNRDDVVRRRHGVLRRPRPRRRRGAAVAEGAHLSHSCKTGGVSTPTVSRAS